MDVRQDGAQAGAAKLTYLVRLWQPGPSQPWRASARHVHQDEEQHFGTLEALYAYLSRQTGSLAGDPR